jgi:hypothetical protein
MATTVSGDAVGLFSLLLMFSFGLGVERNQPLIRDCAGEASGLGDSEGNDVRLLVSSLGEGARLRLRLSDAFELRFDGRMRAMLRFLGFDRVEFCEVVRTRSTDPGVSMAAMSISVYGRAHPCDCGVSEHVREAVVGVVWWQLGGALW